MTDTQIWLTAIGIVVTIVLATWKLQKDRDRQQWERPAVEDTAETAKRMLEIEEARHRREQAQWEAAAAHGDSDLRSTSETAERIKPVAEVLDVIDGRRKSATRHSRSRRQVRATGKDADGDITRLCGSFGSRSKQGAISDIESGVHVYAAGNSLIEVVRDSSVSGGKYLRIRPDGGGARGLDALPDC